MAAPDSLQVKLRRLEGYGLTAIESFGAQMYLVMQNWAIETDCDIRKLSLDDIVTIVRNGVSESSDSEPPIKAVA